jgi:hypothetical protein
LILASLLFLLFPMPVEQMGQVRFGSPPLREMEGAWAVVAGKEPNF